jgi:hypothetical protein
MRNDLCRLSGLVALCIACAATFGAAQQAAIPSTPLQYRVFTATFAADGTFSLQGQGWPAVMGTWAVEGDEVVLRPAGGPPECTAEGRYRVGRVGAELTLEAVADDCPPRRMILHDSR